MSQLLSDAAVIARLLDHIDNKTTDVGTEVWREPTQNYMSRERLDAEIAVMRRRPVVVCPSAALPQAGSYVAREVAGTPLVAVRGKDGRVRVFRNACRHRGVAIATGSGCAKALVCPYHAWTYGLDGELIHVPHADGFPGLDQGKRGLVPVSCAESHGLVFASQDAAIGDQLANLPPLIPESHRLIEAGELVVEANWKIFLESFLEGYHIRSTHRNTFYPIQYDNLNVVESFGPHNRLAFPYQSIEGLRDKPPGEHDAAGRLTYVYHLFPISMVATFPHHMVAIMLEPMGLERTRQVSFLLSDVGENDEAGLKTVTEERRFADTGVAEDREMVALAQRGLRSRANDSFEFGLYESAIGRFHAELSAAIG